MRSRNTTGYGVGQSGRSAMPAFLSLALSLSLAMATGAADAAGTASAAGKARSAGTATAARRARASGTKTISSTRRAAGTRSAAAKAAGSAGSQPLLIAKKKDKEEAAADEPAKDKKDSETKEEKKSREASQKEAKKARKGGFFRKAKDDEPDKKEEETAADATADSSESKSADKAENKAEGAAPAGAAKPESARAAEAAAPAVSVEEPAPLAPDPALISLLRDLSKSLKDSEEAEKIEDACQKAAVGVAALALEKASSNPDLQPDRILSAEEKSKLTSTMTTESWASGELTLSPNCRASLSAVWAKKVDGLLSVSIAGDCGCKSSPSGEKVGEFVLILNSQSTVDTGFDIQSQSDVNYWLARPGGLSVDTVCCPGTGQPVSAAPASKVSQKSLVVLQALVTDRSREHAAKVAAWKEQQRLLALKEEEERQAAEAKEKAEAEAKARAEAEAKSSQIAKAAGGKAKGGGESGADWEGDATASAGAGSAEASAGGRVSARSGEMVIPAPDVAKKRATTFVEDPRTGAIKEVEAPQLPAGAGSDTWQGGASDGQKMAMVQGHGASEGRRGWDSPAPPPAARVPSSAARIVLPERVVAGQFLTAAVVNQNNAAEPQVELSFNGISYVTGQDGRTVVMVPEDAIPGPTMHVAMVARPETAPASIQVLQPLTVPATQQIPRINRVTPMVAAGGVITIDGHHFDGVANRNSVIIDGMWDGRVIVSSPVQLKAELPKNLIAGTHSVTVSTGGLRSNPGQFEAVTVSVEPAVKETAKNQLKKLVVRVNGTHSPARLRVKNYTPEVITLKKGNEQVLTTPGGANNSVTIDVNRQRPGGYHVEAVMEW